ncbi:MAG: MmgE/PrpD family protein [Chloroflexi bacterium]|nr:MmgE/PrpD family protein [Chloroflexota bacterium]
MHEYQGKVLLKALKPKTKETADHSLPYVIAAAVVDGNVLPESFSDEKLKDPRIREVLQKIKVVSDPEIDELFPRIKRARVTITTTDGQRYTAQTDVAKGDPADPMSDEDIIAKFRANARGVISSERMDKVTEATWRLDSLANMREYMELLISDI